MGTSDDPTNELTNLSVIERKIEAAIADIKENRSTLMEAARYRERSDHRLNRIEKLAENISTVSDVVLDTVRSFEAMISIELVQRINALIEERLTVVSELEASRRKERWCLRFSLSAAILLALALGAEIYSGSIGRSLLRIWEAILPASAALGGWIERVAS